MTHPSVLPRPLVAITGPLAAGMFLISLLLFAALRQDGYSHATKAVSELGVLGAPNALLFNLFGFITPGLLIMLFAFGFRGFVRSGGSVVGPVLLALSGLALAVAGIIPADMMQREAWTTVAHAAGAILSGVFWACALFWLGPLLRRVPVLAPWGRLTPWFILFPIANLAWQMIWQTTGLVLPGWGQRLAFAGYFLWLALTGVFLLRAYRLER